jgi:hypothetical protein
LASPHIYKSTEQLVSARSLTSFFVCGGINQ